jgi:glycolate oxidase iron-sulfur subunit
MSACPAGVNYASLFEHARAEVESSASLASPKRSLIRALALRWLFSDLHRLQLAGRALRLYQQLGIQRLLRRSGLLRLLPRRLRELEAMTPDIRLEFSADLIPPWLPAKGERRYRVALLTGCVQDLLFSEINRDTAEVLIAHGCEVITPPEQHCCGSIFAHTGELDRARDLARRHLDQFPPDEFDAIISNAGGCGSHLKHFGSLLSHDPRYAGPAKQWDAKLKDIHEWLIEVRGQRPWAECVGSGVRDQVAPDPDPSHPARIVTYHESCHLCHGQKITTQPRRLLQAIPGIRLVELPESSWCCGSAGVYNLVQPEMAERLLQRKLDHIASTGARVVATANPGCHLQIQNGARKRGLDLQVVHPITLQAEALRSETTVRTGTAGLCVGPA